MKKIILLTLLAITGVSCIKPVLNKDQYVIIDTVGVNTNNFGAILSYDVIVKFEDNFYTGHLYDGELTQINLANKIDTSKLR
jgi:hypothetical protein